MRKYLTGLSAAGITAALVLTATASGAAASPATPASPQVVTLTSSTSSSAGHITLKFRYQVEPKGKIKPLSATFSGGTRIGFKHPAMLLSLRPIPSPASIRGQKPVPRFGFTIILPVHSASHFSGSLPARLLAIIGKIISAGPRRFPPSGSVLQAILVSIARTKPVSISTVLGLQVGVLLHPALP
jgi:hypothetical protein